MWLDFSLWNFLTDLLVFLKSLFLKSVEIKLFHKPESDGSNSAWNNWSLGGLIERTPYGVEQNMNEQL